LEDCFPTSFDKRTRPKSKSLQGKEKRRKLRATTSSEIFGLVAAAAAATKCIKTLGFEAATIRLEGAQ